MKLVIALALVVVVSGAVGLLVAWRLRRRRDASWGPNDLAALLAAVDQHSNAPSVAHPLAYWTRPDAPTYTRNGDQPPGKGPGEARRCPHPACGSQLVPLTITPTGVRDWRCIGCHTEYVDEPNA